MSTVLFERRGDGDAIVRFAYDPELIDLLKAAVPARSRSWDPQLRQWTVRAELVEHFATVLRATGHTVVGVEPDPPPRTGAGTDQWARTLLRRVGPTRREPVFRALTRVLHPDNADTGDTTLQRELNLAREQLTEGNR